MVSWSFHTVPFINVCFQTPCFHLIETNTFLKFSKSAIRRPETAIQQIDAIMALINWFAYFVGIEVRNDWKFNVRAAGNMLMNLWFTWSEVYTFYWLFPSVDCVILSAGCVFLTTVRFSTPRQCKM